MLLTNRQAKELDRRIKAIERQKKNGRSPKKSNFVCPQDFREFCSLLRIRSGLSVVPFELYEHQYKIHQAIAKYPQIIIVKSRQQGVTESILAELDHRANLNPAFLATVFAKNQADTSEFAGRLHDMSAPLDALGFRKKNENKLEFSVVGGGRVLFRNSDAENARSIPSVAFSVFDEAAFSPNIDLIYAASIPSQSMVGDAARNVIISSPNGQGNWFYDRLTSDNNENILEIIEDIRKQKLPPYYEVIDKNGNCKIIIHWRAHPIYGQQPDYLEKVQSKTGLEWDKILQEYDLDFTQSEELIFANYVSNNAIALEDIPPAENYDCFFMGVDVATCGSDFTDATVVGLSGKNIYKVDSYRASKETSDYDIAKIGELLERYDPLVTLIETNGPGINYLEDLNDDYSEYQISGFYSSYSSKRLYVSKVKLALEREVLKFAKTDQLKYELEIYRRFKNGTLGAPSGKHDDTVTAIGLAIMAARKELGENIIRLNLKRG